MSTDKQKQKTKKEMRENMKHLFSVYNNNEELAANMCARTLAYAR